ARPSQFLHSLTRAANMTRAGLARDTATKTDGQRRSQPHLRVTARNIHTWAYTSSDRSCFR
ncbi:hypothetical protein LZ32DRAFT_545509, partial [Colletotrichum eremochloae]